MFTRSFLCLVYTWVLFLSETAEPAASETPLAVAEQLLAAEGHRQRLALAYVLRAIAAMEHGDAAQAITFGQRTLVAAPEDATFERSSRPHALALGYQFAGEVKAARQSAP